TGSEENLAMPPWGHSLIHVNLLFLSADCKSVLASVRYLRINAGAEHDNNKNAILHANTRTHGPLSVSLFLINEPVRAQYAVVRRDSRKLSSAAPKWWQISLCTDRDRENGTEN